MARIRTLVVILAGGAGGRLELLTRERAKPAVPFAGTHRLIDFPLSNCLHAGLSDVWVVQQFNPISLSDHLANGRPWDLDRTTGGLLILQPRLGHDDRAGFQQGTADALWRNAPLIRDFAPEALVVLSADAVYTLDYGALVEDHVGDDADVTIVTVEVDPADAGRYGVVQAQRRPGPRSTRTSRTSRRATWWPTRSSSSPPAPCSTRWRRSRPTPARTRSRTSGTSSCPASSTPGGRASTASTATGATWARSTPTGSPTRSWWRTTRRSTSTTPPGPCSPRRPPTAPRPTRWPAPRSRASLLAPAARVAGTVERSVIGRGAVVEAGAVVRESVVLPGAVVRAGATVERAILDDRVEIGRGASVGEAGGEVALVGMRAKVEEDARIAAGARHPDVED